MLFVYGLLTGWFASLLLLLGAVVYATKLKKKKQESRGMTVDEIISDTCEQKDNIQD